MSRDALVYLFILLLVVICFAFLLRQGLVMYPKLASNLLYVKLSNAFGELLSPASLKMTELQIYATVPEWSSGF